MTIALARILGLYFLGVGLALLLNPGRFRNLYNRLQNNDVALYLGGILALLFGATIVSLYNVWVFNWQLIITLVGWLSLIKGIALLACDSFMQKFAFMIGKPDNF